LLSLLAVFGLIECVPFIDKSNLSLLPGISISCGGMIAVLAFFRDRGHQSADRQRKSDEVYLKIANDAFNEVYNLLKDRNNDRIIWVRASRLLLKAISLKNKLITDDVKSAFSISEEQLRGELYRVLSYKKSEKKNPEPLPPQFFFGIEDWDSEKSLDNAALKSRSNMVVSRVIIDENIPDPSQKPLAIKSVIAIFDFLKFPEDYDDPLETVQDWNDNWEDSNGIFQGAKRFVHHTKRYFVINGKLFDKTANKSFKQDK
jgi:hypothetical protein